MAKKKPKMVWHYEISVWNVVEGDIVKKVWDGTEEELGEIEEQYDDEPFYQIIIDREWEEEEEEDV